MSSSGKQHLVVATHDIKQNRQTRAFILRRCISYPQDVRTRLTRSSPAMRILWILATPVQAILRKRSATTLVSLCPSLDDARINPTKPYERSGPCILRHPCLRLLRMKPHLHVHLLVLLLVLISVVDGRLEM